MRGNFFKAFLVPTECLELLEVGENRSTWISPEKTWVIFLFPVKKDPCSPCFANDAFSPLHIHAKKGFCLEQPWGSLFRQGFLYPQSNSYTFIMDFVVSEYLLSLFPRHLSTMAPSAERPPQAIDIVCLLNGRRLPGTVIARGTGKPSAAPGQVCVVTTTDGAVPAMAAPLRW